MDRTLNEVFCVGRIARNQIDNPQTGAGPKWPTEQSKKPSKVSYKSNRFSDSGVSDADPLPPMFSTRLPGSVLLLRN